jgi:hypothetical protein
MDTIWLVLLAIVIAGGVLVWRQSRTQGRFGISLSRKTCPRCGHPLPMIRKPSSKEETLWGGWTCQNCGAKVDKYGHERPAS